MSIDPRETVREWDPRYLKCRDDVAALAEKHAALGLSDHEIQHAAAFVFHERKAQQKKLSGDHCRSVREDQHARVPAQPPMPEGQSIIVRKDHTLDADGQPIASGEANAGLPERAIGQMPPARDSVSPMPGEGHGAGVQQDRPLSADARQSIASGEGYGVDVRKDQTPHASPARKPSTPVINVKMPKGRSPDARRIARIAAASPAATIMETERLPTGERLGDVRADQWINFHAGNNVFWLSVALQIETYRRSLKKPPIGNAATRDWLPVKIAKEILMKASVMKAQAAATPGQGLFIKTNGQVEIITGAQP